MGSQQRSVCLQLVYYISSHYKLIEFSNIPAECTDVCGQVGQAVNGCKNDSNDDSSEVLQCICTANNANTLIPNCEACVRQYNDNDNDDDSDQYRLLTDCQYTTTTVAAGGAGAAQTTRTETNTDTVVPTNTDNPAPINTVGAAMGLGALGFALGMLKIDDITTKCGMAIMDMCLNDYEGGVS